MQAEVGSGLNLTQELTSPLGRHVSQSPSCQDQCQAFSGKRGRSGHSPSGAHEFSQEEKEWECVLTQPLPCAWYPEKQVHLRSAS